MKTLLRYSLVYAALVAASIAPLATPLQRTLITADVAWWIHVDVDRLKQTEVGQFVFGELDKPEAQAKPLLSLLANLVLIVLAKNMTQ